MTDDPGARAADADPAPAVEALTLSVVPFERDGAMTRVLAAARAIGLLGVAHPVSQAAGVVELVVAAAGRAAVRAVVDGRLVALPVDDVVQAMRMRCAASVACFDEHGVVAESTMPVALERAERDDDAAEVPVLAAAIAPTIPRRTTSHEIAIAFQAEIVDVVVEGRQLVLGRPAVPIVWAPGTRPVVAVQEMPERTVAMVWTRHAVRMLQSPRRREQAMVEPDMLLEWIDEPVVIAGEAAGEEARAIEDALAATLRPRIDAEGRAALLSALEALGIGRRLDELAMLAVEPRSEDTLARLVAVLELPGVLVDVLRGRLHPTALPGARRTPFHGILASLGAAMRQSADADRPRRQDPPSSHGRDR